MDGLIAIIGTVPHQVDSPFYVNVVNVVFDKNNILEIILIVEYIWGEIKRTILI